MFATGSRDGAIYVWDARNGNSSPDGVIPDQCIMNGHRKLGTTLSPYTGPYLNSEFLMLSSAPH